MASSNGIDLRKLEFKLIAGFAIERWQGKHPMPSGNIPSTIHEAAAYDDWGGWKELARKVGYPGKSCLVRKAVFILCESGTLVDETSEEINAKSRENLDSLLHELTCTRPQPKPQQRRLGGGGDVADEATDNMGLSSPENSGSQQINAFQGLEKVVENIVQEIAALESQPLAPTLDKNVSAILTGLHRKQKRGRRKVTCWQVAFPGGGHELWVPERDIRKCYPNLVEDLARKKRMKEVGVPRLATDSQDPEERVKGKRPADGASTQNAMRAKRARSADETAAASPRVADEGPSRILTNSSGAGPSGTHSSFQLGQRAPTFSPDTDTGMDEPFFNSIPSPNNDGLSSAPITNQWSVPLPTAQDPEDVSIAILSHNSSAQPGATKPVQESNPPLGKSPMGDNQPGDPMEVVEQGVPCGGQTMMDCPASQEDELFPSQLAEGNNNPKDDEISLAVMFAERRNERGRRVIAGRNASQAPTEVLPECQRASSIAKEGEKIVVNGEGGARVAISEQDIDRICNMSTPPMEVDAEVLTSRPDILSEVEFTKDVEITVGGQKMLLPVAAVREVLVSKLQEMVENAQTVD